jgi:hypothetical protein
MTRTGQCLCGAVQFTCRTPEARLQACHCVQCQRWTGGGPLIVAHVVDLVIADDATVGRYHASAWGERCFCTNCGSTLYWCNKGQQPSAVAVGLLDDQRGLSMRDEIFVDHRPDWLPLWPAASQSSQEETIAKYDSDLAAAQTT